MFSLHLACSRTHTCTIVECAPHMQTLAHAIVAHHRTRLLAMTSDLCTPHSHSRCIWRARVYTLHIRYVCVCLRCGCVSLFRMLISNHLLLLLFEFTIESMHETISCCRYYSFCFAANCSFVDEISTHLTFFCIRLILEQTKRTNECAYRTHFSHKATRTKKFCSQHEK